MRRIIWLLAFLVLWRVGDISRAATNDGDLLLSDLVREVKVSLLKVAEAAEAQHLPNTRTHCS